MAEPRFREITRVPKAALAVAAPLVARLPGLIGGPADAAERLARVRAAVVGAGSVGRRISDHLARLRVAELWIVDSGRLKAQSMLTHDIAPGEVGKTKASACGRRVKQVSPDTRVFVFDGRVEELDEMALADADVVCVATDNLAAEVCVAQRCLRTGVSLVQGSVYGDALVAEARLLAHDDGSGPCLVCGFTREEWAHLNRSTRFSCEAAGRETAMPEVEQEPTMSVSSLCSMAADLVVTQALRHALALGQPVADTVVTWCGYTHRTEVTALKRNPDCPSEHIVYRRAASPRPLADCTLGELARAAGFDPAGDGVGFTVGDLSFATVGSCDCRGDRPLQRFVSRDGLAGRCRQCGSHTRSHPFYRFRPAPSSVVRDVVDRPLRRLGARRARWVIVRAGDRGVLLREGAGDPAESGDTKP